MVTITEARLCIGCWFAECGGNHLDPDLECPCCGGLIPVEATRGR